MQDFINELLQQTVNPVTIVNVDPEFAALYPRLHAFLTVTHVRAPGGAVVARKTASLSVYVGVGGPQAFLNDRACNRSLVATADTFGGLWAALEGILASDVIPWRMLDGWTPEKKTSSRRSRG